MNSRASHIRLLMLAGCLAASTLHVGAGMPYAVGPRDVVDVSVGGEQDLSGPFEVSDEGTIVYPLLGAIPVAGSNVADIASMIRARLDADYLVDPQVAVYVADYRSKKIAILGDVPKPGFYRLTETSGILELLAEAGLKLDGSDATIILSRAANADDPLADVPTAIELEKLVSPWYDQQPIVLHDGDRLFVRSRLGGKVIVSGKVNRPGVVPLSNGLTAIEAINKAGGIADFGSLKGVRVVRETPEKTDVITLDLSAVLDGDRSRDLVLKDGDIIVVPRRWF